MEFILVIILGLVVGSFLNVCIFRIPNEESISFPPSHCGICGHNLYPKDLIPVFSYIFLAGKCRYCKSKISVQYPFIEILNCLFYFFFALKYGMTMLTLKYCIMASILIVIGMIDLKTQYVYRSVTVTGGACGAAFAVCGYFFNGDNILNYVLGGLIGALVIGLIVFFTRGMGEGDIEIAFICGLFLGLKGILLTLFFSVIIGGITGSVILIMKLKKIKDKIAFGPSLAMGAIITAFFGNEIINAYIILLQ